MVTPNKLCDKYAEWLMVHFGKTWGLLIGGLSLVLLLPIYWLIVLLITR